MNTLKQLTTIALLAILSLFSLAITNAQGTPCTWD